MRGGVSAGLIARLRARGAQIPDKQPNSSETIAEVEGAVAGQPQVAS